MVPDIDPVAATLAGWSRAEQAATEGPWSVSQRHGVDIADEAWSEVKITAPGGDIAATFISRVLENYHDGDDADFIIAARTAMPRLLAAVEAALKLADELGHLGTTPLSGKEDEAAALGIRWVAAKVREAITAELAGEEAGGALETP